MTFTERVMAYFKERPNEWIAATEFEPVGGRQAWRSRIAEARQRFKAHGEGDVENRQRRVYDADGHLLYVVSEYRYVPAVQAEADGQLVLI